MVTTGEHKEQMTTTVLPLHIKRLFKEEAERQDYTMSGYLRHLILEDLREKGRISDQIMEANAPKRGGLNSNLTTSREDEDS